MHPKLKKLIITFGYIVYKTIRIPLKLYWKLCNIQTKGVRVLIVYKDEIILVRHWYNSLWVMPGGGIKKYETPEQAAIREVKEELGITIQQLDYLLGVYSNTKEGKRDTVYCFVVQLDEKILIPKRTWNIEISDSIWAYIHTMPHNTSSATNKRVKEYLDGDVSKDIRPWS